MCVANTVKYNLLNLLIFLVHYADSVYHLSCKQNYMIIVFLLFIFIIYINLMV